MGFSAVVAIVGVIGAGVSIDQGNKAERAREQAGEREKTARGEQKAQQAQQAAQERRQQIREERIRRARIIQSGENTGTSESSGEFGAIGSLSTQLGSNIGFNLGQIASSQRQSDLLQESANFKLKSDKHLQNASEAQQISRVVSSFGS